MAVIISQLKGFVKESGDNFVHFVADDALGGDGLIIPGKAHDDDALALADEMSGGTVHNNLPRAGRPHEHIGTEVTPTSFLLDMEPRCHVLSIYA